MYRYLLSTEQKEIFDVRDNRPRELPSMFSAGGLHLLSQLLLHDSSQLHPRLLRGPGGVTMVGPVEREWKLNN